MRNPDSSVTPLGSFRCADDDRARTAARNRIKRLEDKLNPFGDVVLSARGTELSLAKGARPTVEEMILAALHMQR